MRRRRAQDRVGRERLRVVDERLVPDRRDGQHDRVRGELRRRRDQGRPRVARGAAPGGDAPPREGRVGDGADGDDDREGDPDERLDPRRRGPRVHEERREVDLGGDAVAGNFFSGDAGGPTMADFHIQPQSTFMGFFSSVRSLGSSVRFVSTKRQTHVQ